MNKKSFITMMLLLVSVNSVALANEVPKDSMQKNVIMSGSDLAKSAGIIGIIGIIGTVAAGVAAAKIVDMQKH